MQSCKLGKLPACAQLGRELRNDLPEHAAVHFTKACDGGVVAACFDLAQLLERGEGSLKRDEARAKPLYARVEASCDKGDVESCTQLGMRERSVKPESNRWWMKALVFATQRCASGDGKACQRAARAHRLGEGTPKDEAQAAELLQKSCAAGLKEACPK